VAVSLSNALRARDRTIEFRQEQAERIHQVHGEAFKRYSSQVRALPGAQELLAYLTKGWSAVGHRHEWVDTRVRAYRCDMLGVGRIFALITRDMVRHAKPDPDLFLAAAEKLGVPIEDSGSDRRQHLGSARGRDVRVALGVGLLSGGMVGRSLERAGAYRVYNDPADLLRHLDEVGVRSAE
jgi:phosphoglycolate phosphatase-like HAD superfamily hydrolase